LRYFANLRRIAKRFPCGGAVGIRMRARSWNFGLGFRGTLGAMMISNEWRKRLTYTAMSVFLAWHTLAIVVAPASSSVTAQGIRGVLQPYLSLFRLDNVWNFFAPPHGDMGMSQFRYVIEDKAGTKFNFMPEEEFSGLHPSYFWFRGWYNAIIDNPDQYADIAAAMYCKKHASLSPVSITLLEIEENEFKRSDFLAGKKRWDSEFVTVKTIKQVKCPAE
jgi:hypothetical protein